MERVRAIRYLVVASILSGVLLPLGLARAQSDSVQLNAHWKKGEKRHYVRTKGRIRERDGKVLQQGKGDTAVEIDVLEATEHGYLLGWTWGETTSGDPKADANPLAKAANNLVNGIQFRLQLDDSGALVRVQNVDQLKKQFASVMELMLSQYEKNNRPEAEIANLRATLKSTLLSTQGIEGLLAKEPRIFLVPLGKTYSTSRPLRFQDKLDMPIGKGQVPAQAEYRLASLDRDKNLATVRYKLEIDPEEGARVVQDMLKQLTKQSGTSLPEGDPIKHLAVSDTAEFVIETNTGWPRNITFTRTTQVLNVRQRDTITISATGDLRVDPK